MAALLLALLVASILPLPDVHAQAAAPVFLCFDKDPKPPTPAPPSPTSPSPPSTSAPSGKACPGGFPNAPDYMEGVPVNMSIQNLQQPVTLKAYCDDAPKSGSSCHELVDPHTAVATVFYATLSPQKWWAIFPDDFHEPGPGQTSGPNAKTMKANRYNASWTVAATVQGQDISRSWNTWLLDAFVSDNLTLMPGETHTIRAAGFEPNTGVQILIQRRVDDTNFVNVPLDPAPPPTALDGTLVYSWSIAKGEAQHLASCPADHLADCYQVVVHGGSTSKDVETVPFRLAPAKLVTTILQGPAPNQQPYPMERTMNATITATLTYPGGDRTYGPLLTAGDLPGGAINQPRSLRVSVVRTVSTNTSNPTTTVGEAALTYRVGHNDWQVTWTIPRDLELPAGATFTLHLAQVTDLWGNVVPASDLATYSISAAHLGPVLLSMPTQLGRTDEGRFVYDIRYHNGTPFTDHDNVSGAPLRGCFQTDTAGQARTPCTQANLVAGSFENDTWVFRVRYARDASLASDYFTLQGDSNAADAWGNQVNGTTTSDYAVVPGAPHIDFETVQRGISTTTLERGEHIGVQATITYGDGTPFNHTARWDANTPWGSILNVTVYKRGPDGAIQDTQVLGLQELDANAGLWVSAMDLSLDVEHTPAGRWTFDVLANDTVNPPNLNHTTFDRTVIPTPLRFEMDRTSPLVVSAGSGTVALDFKVYYPTPNGGDPQIVPPETLQSTLQAQAFKWDATNRTITGDSVSGPLIPTYSTDRQTWTVEYAVPGTLFNGSYALRVTGTDRSGNPLQLDAYSRPFTPLSPVLDRQILTQPQPTLERGDAATILVAEHDGDVGPDGAGYPVIRVERWNPDKGDWESVAGAADVRQPSDLNGHFGVFPVTTTTPIGIYHFVFSGREAAPSLAIATNTSDNFTVLSTSVTRGITLAPPERVVKGDVIDFAIERQDGDRIDNVTVLLNGRPAGLGHPTLVTKPGQYNASWRLPFEAPNGNYTIQITGRDVYGNDITVDLPSIEAVAAQLVGKIIGQPDRVVQRGTAAQLIFGIAYPSGDFYTTGTVLPTVVVYNDSDVVASAHVVKQGATYVANWTPPASADIADYWFEVEGEAVGGNSFPSLRSESFRLSPGTFERDGANLIPVGTERTDTNSYSVAIDPLDRFVSFEIGYYGGTSDINAVEGQDALTVTALPHTVDDIAGRYVARFATDQRTPVGAYRIFMKGEDALGNTIVSKSNVFLVRPTTIIVTFDQQPTSSDFAPGKTLTFSFVARYKSGQVLDENLGHPSIALLYQGQPTTQKPSLAYQNGRWVATIQIPSVLADGQYMFAIGGQDNTGNQVSNSRSIPYDVTTPVLNSLVKVVPAPEPALALLALAGVAAALAVGRRRRA